MRRRMNRSGKTGFTLIEMLVVMSIMVIVMGLMLPALMPLLGSKGVEGSTQKLMAVLMNARAMAARENCTVAVTFNMCKDASATQFKASRDWEDSWYAVVKLNPTVSPWAENLRANDAIAPETEVEDVRDTDFSFQQVGPIYRLEEGCGFFALTHKGQDGKIFKGDPDGDPDGFDGNGYPEWQTGTSTKMDGSFDRTSVTDVPAKEYKIPNGYLGNFRIDFQPDGSAAFIYPSGQSYGAEGNSQYIVVSKEGTIGSKSYYDTRLAVRVNSITGLVDIVSGH